MLPSEASHQAIEAGRALLAKANRLLFVVFPNGELTCEPCRVLADVSVAPGETINLPVPNGCNGYQVYFDDTCLFASALRPTIDLRLHGTMDVREV